MTAKRFWRWLKSVPRELWKWGVDAKPVWLAIAVPGFALAGAWTAPVSLDSALVISGVVLQILGLAVLVLNLNALRKALHKSEKGFDHEVKDALIRLSLIFLPKSAPATIELSAGSAEAGGDIANVRLTTGDPEARISSLETEMTSLKKQVQSIPKALAMETESKVNAYKTQLSNVLLRGIVSELIAIFWIMSGMVLSTLSEPLACFLGGH